MSPLDASFLYLEDGVTHLHIASCAVFEGPPPAYREIVDAIAAKLPRIPRYRQVARFVPLQLGRPIWTDDVHFNLEYHLRHTALPHPGGDRELRHLMGRLMSEELDRHRPLWEAWMVEGLEGDRWALVTKIHHCMADGVSGADLLAVLLDTEAVPGDSEEVVEWVPSPGPSALRLTADALWNMASMPTSGLGGIRRLVGMPRQSLGELGDTVSGLWSYAKGLRPVPPTSLVGSIGPHRRWTWASAPLSDFKAIRKSFGGTVNDVILSVIAGGLREQLLARGEPVEHLVVRTLVPVSVRSEDQHGEYNNRVSAMFADLPVSIGDPLERLRSVREQMEALKHSHQAAAGEALTALGGMTPFATVALAERLVIQLLRRMPQHSVNTVTTNVPGPQFPLYMGGRRMLEFLPFVPIAPGVRVGVAIVSYNGTMTFGVTGDYDSAPDIDVMAHGIEDGIAELRKLAAPTHAPRRSSK